MEFAFSKHALEQMNARGVEEEQVDFVMQFPDKVYVESEGQHVFQKQIDLQGTIYLIRVFVNMDKIPPLVRTVYKTSKIAKYQ
jgi:hypothetical protein